MSSDDVQLEMLDVTEAYLASIDKIARENVGALETVGGNLLIHVYGVATRTIVTSGPRKGIYDHPTEDDPIAFAFCLPQWALLHVLDPVEGDPFDLEAAVADGTVVLEGDPALYERFMGLGRNKRSLVSVRMTDVKPTPKKK